MARTPGVLPRRFWWRISSKAPIGRSSMTPFVQPALRGVPPGQFAIVQSKTRKNATLPTSLEPNSHDNEGRVRHGLVDATRHLRSIWLLLPRQVPPRCTDAHTSLRRDDGDRSTWSQSLDRCGYLAFPGE